MKCTLKIATVVLMLGTTVATAQTPMPTQPQLLSIGTGKCSRC